MTVTVYCPTFRPHLFEGLRQRLAGVPVVAIDGRGALARGESKAALFNRCIRAAFSAGADVAVVATEKVLASAGDVERLHKSVDVDRYGAATFYSWSFFAIDRETIRRVGWFDESFPGAGYEDADYVRRCCFHDVGIYSSFAIGLLPIESSWPDDEPAKAHLRRRWSDDEKARRFVAIGPLPESDLRLPASVASRSSLLPWRSTRSIFADGSSSHLNEWTCHHAEP